MLKLGFVLSSTNGNPLSNSEHVCFSGVSTDSKKIKGGELFIALRGSRFDGHDFVSEALVKGAKGAVVEEANSFTRNGKVIIQVPSTLKALGDLARAWKNEFPDLRLAAITGSNGKTTTKEMTSSMLALKFSVLKNSGNFNNLIGLPLTLLKIDEDHNAAVVELGMNEFGEIRRLAEIANPDTGTITNIGSAHLEKLGSIEGVAKAKGELVEGFSERNTFVVNMDDPQIQDIAKGLRCKKIPYGLNSAGLLITAKDISPVGFSAVRFNLIMGEREIPIRIRGIGIHNVMNALCAAGLAFSFGCDSDEIQAGLERYFPVYMRLEVLDSPYGFKIINDSYNSNPDSMRRAIEELIRLKGSGRAIAVLGDMLELGTRSEQEHKGLGEFLSQLKVDYVISFGKFGMSVLEGLKDNGRSMYAESHEEAAQAIINFARKEDLVLIKGSRGMKMENVVQRLYEG